MSKLLDVARASEKTLFNRFGNWIVAVSQAVDGVLSGSTPIQSLLLPEQATTPPTVPNAGSVFTRDVNGVTELFFVDSSGVVQLTSQGQLAPYGFLAQGTWFVNATTGNDTNDGATAATAIQTLPELSRRLLAKYSKIAQTINLVGQFADPLSLEFVGSPGLVCRINGETPTVVDSGSLTGAYQAYSAAANTDARLTDAAQAWAALVNARVRFTSGAASGNIAWVLKDLGAGVARISQLVNPTTGNASPNPGVGDTYVVETLNTRVAGLRVRLAGGIKFDGRDLRDHCEDDNHLVQYVVASGQIAQTVDQAPECRLVGCMFTTAVVAASHPHNFTQSHVGFIGTHSTSPMRFSHCRLLVNGHSFTQSFGMNAGTRVDVQIHLIGQGATFVCFPYSCVTCSIDGNVVSAGLGIYDAGGSACLDLDCNSQFTSAVAGNTLFGTGNTSTNGARVRTGGGMYYLTQPTITGPATEVLIGGAANTWAATAAGVTVNGATVAPRA